MKTIKEVILESKELNSVNAIKKVLLEYQYWNVKYRQTGNATYDSIATNVWRDNNMGT